MKTHFKYGDYVACNYKFDGERSKNIRKTDNLSNVTCKNCLNKIGQPRVYNYPCKKKSCMNCDYWQDCKGMEKQINIHLQDDNLSDCQDCKGIEKQIDNNTTYDREN